MRRRGTSRTTLLALLLAAGLCGSVLGQEEEETTHDPFSWRMDWLAPVGPDRDPYGVALWLPARPREGGKTTYADALGNANALLEDTFTAAFVRLHGMADPDMEDRLDVERAVLTVKGGPELACTRRGLGGMPFGHTVQGRGPGAVMAWLISFPPLKPEWSEFELRVPLKGAEGEPLVMCFWRLRERVTQVENDLQDWIKHCHSPQTQLSSAIRPYLECAGWRRFQQHAEQLRVPFLLRELDRSLREPEAGLPRFLVFHALADTEWGRERAVPDGGTEQQARAILKAWARHRTPQLPGVWPPD